jgi:hypothetical protein
LAGSGWTIVEAPSFDAGAAACGGHRLIEEIIAPVKLGLSRNPKQFLETQRPGIWLAKTKTHWRGPEIILAYSIWFKVIDEVSEVVLLYIAYTNPDEADWGSGDEVPF